MKKTLLVTILVAVMLLAAIGSVNAVSVTPENKTVKAGETLTVVVDAEKLAEGISFDVDFNTEYLRLEGATAEGMSVIVADSVATTGKGTIAVFDAAGKAKAEEVTLTFTALKDTTEASAITITNMDVDGEVTAAVGSTEVTVNKVEEQDPNEGKDPVDPEKPDEGKDPVNPEKPNNGNKPTDVHGNEITQSPQMGTPLYIVAIAVIVIAAGAIFVVRKNK